MERISIMLKDFTNQYLVLFTEINLTDILEILIIAVFVYQVLKWIINTKAWMLLRGIAIICAFIFVANILKMDTILYLAAETLDILAVAAIVVFQPELRRALENLGQKKIIGDIVPFDTKKKMNELFSEYTVDSIVEACIVMSRQKTGALIVVEQQVKLTEYEKTGIQMDCVVSNQVLLNIFEHNTPLHDGAIVVRGDRIMSATCYLPLSDNNNLSKNLGTRHRAALGMSEVSDAVVIVVSEETGNISTAIGGVLYHNIGADALKTRLQLIRDKSISSSEKPSLWMKLRTKGGIKNEK